MRCVGVAWVVVAVLAGCSDEAPAIATPDAGADAGRWAPEPPRIPWLAAGVPPIAIAPCPPGWREVHDGDVPTCDPYPEAGPEACDEGFAHFPGGSGCEPVGSACPAGEWPDGLPASGVVYVRAGEPAGGDGTRAAPFARIGDAMSVASAGDVVALSGGRWDETVTIRAGVTLRGTCTSATVLTSSVPSDAPVVAARAAGTALRDVRIEGYRPGLLVSGADAELEIGGVIIAGTQYVGVAVVDGARLTGASIVVRDTQSRQRDRALGQGLFVGSGASAQLARVLLERNRDNAILAAGVDTRVRIEDLVVRNTRSRESDREHGGGLIAQEGSTVAIARALFDHNKQVGVFAVDAGTNVHLEDVIVRDTQSQESDGTHGDGLYASGGARAEAVRALFERNRYASAFSSDAGTTLRLEDVVVRDTLSRESDQAGGLGCIVDSARAELSRVLFERSIVGAVFIEGVGAGARLEDVVVRDTRGDGLDGAFGRGIEVWNGGADVARALLEANRELGVMAAGPGVTVRLEDVVVRDTLPAQCGMRCAFGAGGMGVASYQGATLSMNRFVVQRAALCGVQVALGGELDLSDGDVRESAIGACVQVPGYRLSRLNASVVYVDNGANLEATDFPVPEVFDPVGGL